MNKIIESPDVETASLVYAKRFSGQWGEYLLAEQKARVAECIPAVADISILEVGGGHAQLASIYAERGLRPTIYGSDGATTEQLKPFDVNYVSGNVVELPFEDDSFDVVIAIRLLTHLEHWEALLGEMCRVSKGIIIVEYPSKFSLNAIAPLLFTFKKKYEGDTRAFRLFSDKEVKAALRKHGYKVSSRKGQFFFPLVVHRMLKSNGLLKALESALRKLKVSHVLGSPVVLSAHKLGK